MSLMNPDADIQLLLDEGETDAACGELWRRYRLKCVQFLAVKFPNTADDVIASGVADAFLQLHEALEKREAGVEWPLRNRLFLFATRRVLDAVRRGSAKRRGGDVEWLMLDEQSGEIGDREFGQLIDEIVVNEVRERLLDLRRHISSPNQQRILTVICETLPNRVYLGDLPDMLRERGFEPPRPTTLKRSLQELRRKLARDPVLRDLRAEPSL